MASDLDFEFDHIHLVSGDVDTMIDYFVSVFGATRLSYNPDNQGAAFAFVQLGNIRVGIRGLRHGETPDAVAPVRVQGLDHFGIVVDNLEQAAQRLKERGAEFSVEPGMNAAGSRMVAFIRGPENIEIELLGPIAG